MNAQAGLVAAGEPPRYLARLKGSSILDVYLWALQAKIGERVSYHSNKSFGEPVTLPTYIGNPAYRASQEGLVFLAQRRVLCGFRYEATRISVRTARALGLIGRRAELLA